MLKCIILLILTSSLCYSQIPHLIDNSDIRYKRIAKSIAYHETGNYKSRLYRIHNNAFGFRGKTYKSYKTKKASVDAYYEFEKKIIKKYKTKNYTEYLRVLSRIYATSPQWGKHITKQLKTY